MSAADSAAAPDYVVACVGGGSNAAGTFAGFVGTPAQLVGVEAAGGAAMGPKGVPGVLHGMRSYLLQDEFGQILEANRYRPASTTRASARSTPIWPRWAAPVTGRPPTTKSSRLCSCSPVPRGSSLPSSPPTLWPGWSGRPGRANPRPARPSCSRCRGGGTRTPST